MRKGGKSTRKLTIYRHYFTAADAYNENAPQQQTGVQVHSTGANNPRLSRYVQPDDGRLGNNANRNSHNRPDLDVCANAYVGRLSDGTVAVYQALPWDYRAWLSGKGKNGNANRMGYIGFEICEDGLADEAYFRDAVMGKSVLLTAHLCTVMGVKPDTIIKAFGGASPEALAVMSHAELHDCGLASNHGDIDHWLERYGLTMDDYRAAVAAAMEEGVEVTYVDAASGEETAGDQTPPADPALFTARVISTGYLNIRAQPSLLADRVGRVDPGAVVEVLEESGADWWRIRTANATGWAATRGDNGRYLRRIDAVTVPDETVTVVIPDLPADVARTMIATYPGAYALEELKVEIK